MIKAANDYEMRSYSFLKGLYRWSDPSLGKTLRVAS